MKTGQLIERPRRLVEPPADWLRKVKLAPPPRRSKGRPSISEYVARGFKPSDEISKPSRRELEDALDRAGKMATPLGYRLSYWLVPVNPPILPEGSDDG